MGKALREKDNILLNEKVISMFRTVGTHKKAKSQEERLLELSRVIGSQDPKKIAQIVGLFCEVLNENNEKQTEIMQLKQKNKKITQQNNTLKKENVELVTDVNRYEEMNENYRKNLYNFLNTYDKLVDNKKELEDKTKKLETINSMDGLLVDIYNRRYFDDNINIEIEKAKSKNAPISLLLIDIDNFSRFNNDYDHITGDKALKYIVQRINNALNDNEIAEEYKNKNFERLFARYGGEEFVILLPDTDLKTAEFIAQKIRRRVSRKEFVIRNANDDVIGKETITCSIGVAGYDENNNIIKQADDSMYKVKANGKNGVCVGIGEVNRV